MKRIKIIQIGLGSLGQKIVNYAIERKGIDVVAAVDMAPDKRGKDLGEVCSLDKKLGTKVCHNIELSLRKAGKDKPDVALLTTVSELEKIILQIEEIAKYGINIISTCEELTFPWNTRPNLAKKIDEIAKKYNISVLSTGVNPGFLMDFFPVVMTGICQEVKGIKVSRIQDASFRRVPFQKKIGAGLTLDEFEQKKQSGTLRHVGLTESIHMIAYKMGWTISKTEDILTPVIAELELIADRTKIIPGTAAGVQQIGRGYVDGEEKITLEFRAAIGEKNPLDAIEIKGIPDISLTIKGGIHGDIATSAIVINAVKSIMDLTPGLKTMADIPAISFWTDLENRNAGYQEKD